MEKNPTHIKPMVATKANLNSLVKGTPIFFVALCRTALHLQIGQLDILLPDGRSLSFKGESDGPQGTIVLKNYNIARSVILQGDVGFFESYAREDWDTPDLSACLHVIACNADHIANAFDATPIIKWLDNVRHFMNRNTKTGSKRNIVAHYDLGNAFYEKWLDRTMTYSAALYQNGNIDLARAQEDKYSALASMIDLKPGQHLLEIGSGWGGFAEFAAKHVDAKVTGVTISPSQLEFAKERIHREGLSEKVEIRLQDYRDIDGQFDRIASIEMFEAVGREYWPTYFNKVHSCLKPGGLAGLQIITIADRFFEHYRRSPDFIQRYVFPGGMLPSPSILRSHVKQAGLEWRDAFSFGEDYATTLKCWRDRFLAVWEDLAAMGFDARFNKLWRYYLSYCEAGFRAKTTDVMQVALSR